MPPTSANWRRAHWYDGLAIERVQDDYVTQWGDPDGKKPLPAGLVMPRRPSTTGPPRPAFHPGCPIPTLTPSGGVSGAFPAAETRRGEVWLTHCYGMVGVGRDLNPDTGTGAELYAVIGHAAARAGSQHRRRRPGAGGHGPSGRPAPRHGRPRLLRRPGQRQRIVRVASPPICRSPSNRSFQVLRVTSASYGAWIHAKANRQDTFFVRPANALDVCNAMPPVRGAGRVGM